MANGRMIVLPELVLIQKNNFMVYHFQNILVPVDFTINTDAAIDNAIAMCDVNNTKVHLFHVKVDYWTVAPYHINGSFAMPGDNIIEKGISIEEGLFKLKKSIQVRYPLLDILTHVGSSGKVQEAIISKAKQVKADLIVISKNNSHQWFGFFNLINSSVIARETKSAVLNVVPGTRLSKIKNIVMPLRSFIPGRKLELLLTITNKHKPTVHIVTVQKGNKSPLDSEVFIDTYRSLSQELHYPVTYKVSVGNNIAKNILKYAQKIDADIVMVNPFDETSLSSLLGTHITDMADPKLSVLTASPYD